ncbi:MAG: glutamate mutase L [Chloroflexota bacterium]
MAEESQDFIEEFQEAEDSFRSGSLMTVDIGSITTRAALFDLVEGRARFLASGSAVSTAGPPLFDASEGVRFAMDQVSDISGRILTQEDGRPIIPFTGGGAGVDFFSTTFSAGSPLKTVVVGLLDEVSLTSAKNLADTTYTNVIASVSLSNSGKPETYIDKILKERPDVILIAGGTDEGAGQSVFRLVNSIGMAMYLLPEGERPSVLYAGNSALAAKVKKFFDPLTKVFLAPNIRPALSVEQLGPARAILTEIYNQHHISKVLGVAELNTWSSGNFLPSSHAIGRVTRFFSKIIPKPETTGVLSVDVGASSTVVAGGFNGDLRLRVFTDLGMGQGLSGVLKRSQLADITRWIPVSISPNYVLDYIQNKIIHPSTLPATLQDTYIEQAIGREVLSRAVKESMAAFPKNIRRLEANTLPVFDPIVISGGVFTNAPSPAYSLLMILDALQPTGIQRILLDKNHLSAGLGAASIVVPALISQLLFDPTVFINLGFVVSPISRVRQGTAILQVRVQYESGHETTIKVQQGNIQSIPIPMGQRAKVFLDPLHRANIGLGPGRSTSMQVIGGLFGLVVDARGRPINLPSQDEARHKLLLKWQGAFLKDRL